MSDKTPPTDIILSSLMDYIISDPKDLTYIAIGSAPHMELEKIDERWDQMIPKFLNDDINNSNKKIRIINIDPMFDQKRELLIKYFDSKNLGFKYDDNFGMQIWKSANKRIEVIILPISFYHQSQFNQENNDWFFELMTEHCIKSNCKLIVQEYTGAELNEVCRNIYSKTSDRDLFKKNILFDVTYGEDCHCCTDLTKYKPIIDSEGNFCNITLFNSKDMIKSIGIRPEIDKYIKSFFIKKYKTILNDYHVDYRRKLRGEQIMFKHHKYNDTFTPQEIMKLLLDELSIMYNIFRKFDMITPEKEYQIGILFINSDTKDVYNWYESINKII